MSKYVYARPIHPGELLKKEIEYRGLSQSKLAAYMGMSYKIWDNTFPDFATSSILFSISLSELLFFKQNIFAIGLLLLYLRQKK
jgi:transcriptional regulator with XRE-family HTH domain